MLYNLDGTTVPGGTRQILAMPQFDTIDEALAYARPSIIDGSMRYRIVDQNSRIVMNEADVEKSIKKSN